jgi:DNA (cytosine-5)-methyltransferase 1
VDAAAIPDFDILCAGFPCQAFSIIGSRRGFADTRGTLFFDVERILAAKRPRAFMLENVKQLVGHDDGRTFAVILEKLRTLGYTVHHRVLDGRDFGVPQKRERIIIVGFDRDIPFEFPTAGLARPKTLTQILEADDEIEPHHLASPHIRAKVAARLQRSFTRPSILHENKSGNIGVHPYSCALRANASYNYLLVNGERRLTPREMFRLQGYPDTFKLVGTDSQLRKQAGNSVVVPKIEAVAKAMLDALAAAEGPRRKPCAPRVDAVHPAIHVHA